jgi:DNA anti-recombination protein RmuC
MNTIDLLLLVLLALAAGGIVVALRRPAQPAAPPELVRAEVGRLADAMARQGADERELRGDVTRVRELVEGLRSAAQARARVEESVWEAVRRMESVVAGGAARGRAGENLLDESQSTLPAGMLVRDFAVGGRRVEFALVLPDGRRLPVDSKWTATRELEALQGEEDPDRRRALCRRVEDEVVRRAREVEAYIDPSLTTPFAVACVPDAAFAVCRKAHGDAFARRIVLVGQSTALPVLLTLYALAARYGAAGDVDGCLSELETLLGSMEVTLENKVAKAATMLQNAADEWRTHVGKARGAVARGRGVSGDPGALDSPNGGVVTSTFGEWAGHR